MANQLAQKLLGLTLVETYTKPSKYMGELCLCVWEAGGPNSIVNKILRPAQSPQPQLQPQASQRQSRWRRRRP